MHKKYNVDIKAATILNWMKLTLTQQRPEKSFMKSNQTNVCVTGINILTLYIKASFSHLLEFIITMAPFKVN